MNIRGFCIFCYDKGCARCNGRTSVGSGIVEVLLLLVVMTLIIWLAAENSPTMYGTP